MNRPKTLTNDPEPNLRERATKLGLYGLLAHWNEVENEAWLSNIIEHEEKERGRRSLERRIRNAKIGRFKPMADFDWSWPTEIDRELIEDVFRFEFLDEAANVLLVGPNGVGKTMIAQNLAHQAILRGSTVRLTTASKLLNELIAQETGSALSRHLRRYTHPQLLVIDEVGYLSTSSEHADLLFEVITWRYLESSSLERPRSTASSP